MHQSQRDACVREERCVRAPCRPGTGHVEQSKECGRGRASTGLPACTGGGQWRAGCWGLEDWGSATACCLLCCRPVGHGGPMLRACKAPTWLHTPTATAAASTVVSQSGVRQVAVCMPSAGVRMRGHGAAIKRDMAAPGALRDVLIREKCGGLLKMLRSACRVLELAVKVTQQRLT